MAAKKVLVVFGATGNQGGSIIKSFLGDSKASAEYSLRGITRDTSSAKAKALQEKGVETVTVCPGRCRRHPGNPLLTH